MTYIVFRFSSMTSLSLTATQVPASWHPILTVRPFGYRLSSSS